MSELDNELIPFVVLNGKAPERVPLDEFSNFSDFHVFSLVVIVFELLKTELPEHLTQAKRTNL